MAQKIISIIKNERRQMIRGIERLCDAYISLAYMDASKHKNEKSEWSERSEERSKRLHELNTAAFVFPPVRHAPVE